MQKIPTLFRRDPENMRHVLAEVTPGCEWVLAGEGQATRKYDGTCVRLSGGQWFARREVRAGKVEPPNFIPIEHDETTGKTVGWEPIEQSGFAKWHAQAVNGRGYDEGTYELCGPKINKNPEHFDEHTLVRHLEAEPIVLGEIPAYGWLSGWMPTIPYEGIVWHHPDGRMAKLKRRDFT